MPLDKLQAELSFWRWVAGHYDEYLERYASADELANLSVFALNVRIRALELMVESAQRKESTHELHRTGDPAKSPDLAGKPRTPTHHAVAAVGVH